MSTIDTVSTQLEKELSSLSIIVAKIEKHPEVAEKIRPIWIRSYRHHLMRLKECAAAGKEWGHDNTDGWRETSSKLSSVASALKTNDHANSDWDNTTVIVSELNNAWRSAAIANHNYAQLIRQINELASLYLDQTIADAELASAQSKAREAVRQIEKTKNDLEDTLRQEAQLSSIKAKSNYFADLADENAKQAKTWLKAMVCTIALLIAAGAIEIALSYVAKKEEAYSLQHIAGRLIIISSLFYLLRVFSQNYRQNEHNRILNVHRSKSLLTFETMASAVKDKDARSMILTKAADAVFASQPTGMENGSSSREVTELKIQMNGDKGPPN